MSQLGAVTGDSGKTGHVHLAMAVHLRSLLLKA